MLSISSRFRLFRGSNIIVGNWTSIPTNLIVQMGDSRSAILVLFRCSFHMESKQIVWEAGGSFRKIECSNLHECQITKTTANSYQQSSVQTNSSVSDSWDANLRRNQVKTNGQNTQRIRSCTQDHLLRQLIAKASRSCLFGALKLGKAVNSEFCANNCDDHCHHNTLWHNYRVGELNMVTCPPKLAQKFLSFPLTCLV